jgi:predicted metal-dependent phosphoesterase TrpH
MNGRTAHSTVVSDARGTHSKVDLHVHTTASDGELSPAELVQKALEIGLAAVAITDHDTTEGVTEALEAARGTRLDVVAGVEISTDISRSEAHILGYFIAHRDRELCDKLSQFRTSRLERARRMIAKLTRMGLPLEWELVRQIACGESIGRPHIAQALLQKGYVSSIDEAFRLYIGRRGLAYVERHKLSPGEAVQVILAAGGLPVLAHPLYVSYLVPDLASKGLVGLEAYYTGYTADETASLLDLAARYGLMVTGGSDFHGDTVQPGHQLGGVSVPYAVMQKLSAYRDRRLRRLGGEGAPICS